MADAPHADERGDSAIQPVESTGEDNAWVDLAAYGCPEYDPGRGFVTRTCWYFVSLMMFESGWLPLSRPKQWLLRAFGARIGRGLVIKPHVRIKYPWRLSLGDHCWIGQDVWIDNLADVSLGNHVCVSQRAYLCTGSHDHRRTGFDLIVRPIHVASGGWVGAGCLVLGGVTIGANGVAAAGSVVAKTVPPGAIVRGNPAEVVKMRAPPVT